MTTDYKALEESKALTAEIKTLSRTIGSASSNSMINNEKNAAVIKEALETNLNNLIESNERLSTSNEHYSKWTKGLTFALVFFTAAQLLISYAGYRSEQRTMNARKDCFMNVLQTSNIDLNYKNCLRNNGVAE